MEQRFSRTSQVKLKFNERQWDATVTQVAINGTLFEGSGSLFAAKYPSISLVVKNQKPYPESRARAKQIPNTFKNVFEFGVQKYSCVFVCKLYFYLKN